MNSPTDWTDTTLQVRYAETDQMGVVYYANFLVWFEIGRTDFCRKHGFAYRDMEQQDGLFIMVAEARCRYKAPARYDDEILVRTHLKEIRRRVLIFAYEVYRQAANELLAEGETVHVITDRDGHPRSLPDNYRELFVAGPKESGHTTRALVHGSRDSENWTFGLGGKTGNQRVPPCFCRTRAPFPFVISHTRRRISCHALYSSMASASRGEIFPQSYCIIDL